MKDLRPKIKKVLLKTLKDFYSFGDYTIYEKDGYIRVKENDASDFSKRRGWDDEAVAWVPEYEHNDTFSFICEGGILWELLNPCYADYPLYKWETIIYKNFEEVGLMMTPYDSCNFEIEEDE